MNNRINRAFAMQIKKNPYLRASQNKLLQQRPAILGRPEHFNANLQFRPYELYLLTDETGKYAITYEDATNSVFLSPADDKNKNQWVFMDSDTGNNGKGGYGGTTGTIVFFNATGGYLSVDYKNDPILVTRNDNLIDTIFSYKGINQEIVLRDKPDYCLAYKRIQSTPAAPSTAPPAQNPAPEPEPSPTTTNPESYVIRSVRRALRERFNKETEPELILLNLKSSSINKGDYSYRWTWHRVVDLRDFIKNAELDAQNKKMLEESSNKADAQQKVIKNLELQKKTDSDYYNSIIKGYEELPGIKWFNKVSATLSGVK